MAILLGVPMRQRGLATRRDTQAAATTSSGSTEIHSPKVMSEHKLVVSETGNTLSTLRGRCDGESLPQGG